MKKKLKQLKLNWLVICLLLLGVLFKLYLTSGNNIIFHMDSARDYVDVREMVELLKPRLIGQTSAIEGFYTGPGWYYLLAIPYLLFNGDPYGGVVLMIVMWGIGGYFLYLITKKYGILAWLTCQLIWFGSPSISLSTVYSFNPHPVLYFTTVFIYLLEKYITTEKTLYALLTSFVAALFFQWEMNTGVFAPLIIIATIVIAKKFSLFKTKGFWLSVGLFAVSLLPQILFDLRHQFLMSNAIIRFLSEGGAGKEGNIIEKIVFMWHIFYDSFTPALLNSTVIVKGVLALLVLSTLILLTKKRKEWLKDIDLTLIICLLTIIIPFIGYVLIPVNVHPWHMVSIIAAMIVLVGFLINLIKSKVKFGSLAGVLFLGYCLILVSQTTLNGFAEHGKQSDDPSNLANELKAIDFAYQEANGENFKAYSYLPSVIDYPYQYLYWWYGLKKYGYTPTEYVYLSNKPQYISNKDAFTKPKNASDSGLVILIKEPDRIKMRQAWEGNFANTKLLKHQWIGPLEVEARR